jgi:prepilin-type N-terminal cleavage/methylation domain-containing protein
MSIPGSRARQSGMSLIELMIAMVVLVVGICALMLLVTTATSSNNRNKLDTTGTLLAQKVLEGIAAQPATQNTPFTMTDCNPAGSTAWTIGTASAASPGNGATLDGSGNISYSAQTYAQLSAAFPNYAMLYVTCGVGGTQATYDVRWNVRTLTAYTKLVTVSARQLGVSPTGNNLPFFSPPVTLRTIAGQ